MKLGIISVNEIQQTYHIQFALLSPKTAHNWFLGLGVSKTTDIGRLFRLINVF